MKRAYIELALVLIALAAVSAAATRFVNQSGWTLYYGDAEAHLNIARRIVDSRTPGYDQIGSPWLPLPPVLTLIFVQYDPWWRNGLAGAIPSSACFVLAGLFLFAAVRRALRSSSAAFVALWILALNPNLLYLQATPMTEPVFLAAFMALLYSTILFRDTQSLWAVAGAGLASVAASLSRYEGWFLIPFVTLYFLFAARRRRLVAALIFGAIASLAPIYWLAHNDWLYGNPLEFYNGPYSAKGIYQRALAQHMPPSPGDHDWKKAWLFFRTTVRICTGWGALLVAAVGLAGAIWKRAFWPLALVAIPPLFYLWRMYAGESPIFVPELWFSSYYNTRYALSVLPLLAIAGAGVVMLAPNRLRPVIALCAIAAAATPWLIHRKPDDWICWKESQVNSVGRRAWTRQASQLLAAEYRPGTGIYTSLGDDGLAILREAGIPLREALRDANEPAWMAATTRPDLFLHEEWALSTSGDPVATAVQRATFKKGPRYYRVLIIMVKGEPVIEIYKRD
ncbi:MAG: glycosyltransferase family 39 protein [Bryobacteraceae bacterium]